MQNKKRIKIYIGRHGQDEDNANGILNGQRDTPLTALGREQAKDLADNILEVGLKFDVIYTSPLLRARETAEIIRKTLKLQAKPIVMPGLIERDFGIMTGKKVSEIEKYCAPDIIKGEKITYFLKPEGAETFPALLIRAKKAVRFIQSHEQADSVLLICHGDTAR